MIYTLKNDILEIKISSMGAELVSAKRGDCEYVWQGDEKYWSGQCPILFPICGRLFGGNYTFEGKSYEMNIHGFARHSEFAVVSSSDSEIVLSLSSNADTLAQYPFDFQLTVTYTLTDEELMSSICISNTGDKTMPATFGAHPGFNVPLDTGSFEDWSIEFFEDCTPNELVFSDTCFNTGKKRAFPLKDSRSIPLRHSLFDVDAIFLDRVSPIVCLRSDVSERSVTLVYRDMPYLGLWHKPRTDAPYVCIEPWCGLPTYDGITDDLSTKNDMFAIESGKNKTLEYSIIFN